jgi:hypothetical protein
MQSVSDIHL